MTPQELIAQTRLLETLEIPKVFVETFAFKPTQPVGETSSDLNLDFRIKVVDELLHDFSNKDLALIRLLYKEELACERLIWRHDNIYKLSYYLFQLGQIEDCFLIYEAKYQIMHMDVATVMDREMLTIGHDIDKVILFVSQKIRDNPEFAERFEGLLEQLIDLKENPDCDSEEYKKFLKGYYAGNDNVDTLMQSTTKEILIEQKLLITEQNRKPWWKFW